MLTNEQIVQLYWGGLTIDRLTRIVKNDKDMECRTAKDARGIVERVIYEDHMRRNGKWKPEYGLKRE